jgi:membrane-bound lytic murein transglycosylase D
MRLRLLVATNLLVARVAAATPSGSPIESPAESLSGRRAIRGEAVAPARESEELRELRRFEEASLQPPGPGAERVAGDEAPPSTAAQLQLPDLPVRWDARVLRYLDFYRDDRRGRAIMTSWLRSQGRYRAMIEAALRRAHLPAALLYVAMIESGYDPLDRSSAGASGLWQFMPEGGRIYGLRIDRWVDERNDPEKSTAAAMRYLDDLHARFGSWHLALAAFNAGYGAVLAAAAKYNTNDYWELARHEDGLPWETVLYVPKLLASAIVGGNRAAYGYADVAASPPLEFERAPVPTSTSLAAVARAAGVGEGEVAALNPELRHGRTPPEPWLVRLPRGTSGRFLASFERNRERVGAHVVRFGERLETIARAYHISKSELKRLNDLKDASEVRPGLTLVVPSRGEALPSFGAPVQREAPSVKRDDEVAIVAVPDREVSVAGRRRLFYRVGAGDDLGDVAHYFHVSPAELARWNALDLDARLVAGMVVQVWVGEGFDEHEARDRGALLDPSQVRLCTVGTDEFLDLVEGRRGRKRLTYEVRHGDTFKRVAGRFGLSEGDLERINRCSRTAALAPGQKLTVYVPMTPAERRAWNEHGLPRPLPAAPAGPSDDEEPMPAEAAAAAATREASAPDGAGGEPRPRADHPAVDPARDEEPAPERPTRPRPDAAPERLPGTSTIIGAASPPRPAHRSEATGRAHAPSTKAAGPRHAAACPPCAAGSRRRAEGCRPCAHSAHGSAHARSTRKGRR